MNSVIRARYRNLISSLNIRENDACDNILSVYPHRASFKNMPDHGGNRTYDLTEKSVKILTRKLSVTFGMCNSVLSVIHEVVELHGCDYRIL
jgi:hypothetical protein